MLRWTKTAPHSIATRVITQRSLTISSRPQVTRVLRTAISSHSQCPRFSRTPYTSFPVFRSYSHTKNMINTPLTQETTPFLDWKLFPDYEKVLTHTTPMEAIPVFEALFREATESFARLETELEPTWEGSIVPLHAIEERVSRAFALLSHLNSVKNSPDVRQVIESIQPHYVKLGLVMNQSIHKYQALSNLKASSAWDALDAVQQRIVEHALRDMQHTGVGLADGSQEKIRFNAISERLSQLTLTFSNNALDATKSYRCVITDKSELDGCSEAFLSVLQKNAETQGVKEEGKEETYCITLDYPVYGPFMMNCRNRSLREKIYIANITKASSGATNNEPVINEILTLKHEKANLLGYASYADYSLACKMAANVATATDLMDRLFDASVGPAHKEFDALTDYAATHLQQPVPLQPWDVAYVTEQYRKEKFCYDDETISKYFAFPKVLKGLFDVAHEMFDVQVRELTVEEKKDHGMTVWHEDVRVFQVSHKEQVRAYFYGDFYSRPSEKRSGAWMDVIRTRHTSKEEGEVLPVAYLICNQPAPQSEEVPSLMKFRDVETLFHEFGHCLQHMLTTVEYPQASGIAGVEWDFVEVASQFMENFCQEPKWLARLSGHYETGEAIPDDMVQVLVQNRKFMSGMAMLRQLHFSKLDLAIHSGFVPPTQPGETTVFDIDAQLSQQIAVVPRLPQDRLLCSFGHIFSGGYSAGYYSYKWSETYSADAYAAFEEVQSKGESLQSIGERYRNTILAMGGGTDPREVWRQFRGRSSVDVDALLHHTGLKEY